MGADLSGATDPPDAIWFETTSRGGRSDRDRPSIPSTGRRRREHAVSKGHSVGSDAAHRAELQRLRREWNDGTGRDDRRDGEKWFALDHLLPAAAQVLASDDCADDTAVEALDLMTDMLESVAIIDLGSHGGDYRPENEMQAAVSALGSVDPSMCTTWRGWAVRAALSAAAFESPPLRPDWDPWPVLEAATTTDGVRLGALAADVDPAVRREVAHRGDLSGATQIALASDPDASVRIALANNPDIGAETVALLAEGDADVEVGRALAQRPHASGAVLDALARRFADDGVRVSVVQHPSVTAEILDLLAADPSYTVRTWAAGHPACPIDAVMRAARDGVGGAAANPSLSPEQIAELAADAAVPTFSAASNPSCPPDLLRRLVHNAGSRVEASAAAGAAARHPNCPPDLALELLQFDHPEVPFTTAAHQPLPPDVLAGLVREGTDRYPAERWLFPVAGNPHCPAELVRELEARDPNTALAAQLPIDPAVVPESLADVPDHHLWALAGNPSASPELLRALTDRGMSMAVAGNPGAPPDVLIDAIAGPDFGVFHHLADNPGAPPWLARAAGRSDNPVEVLASLALELHLRHGGGRDPDLAVRVADLVTDWQESPQALLDAAASGRTESR
jgi:hypothetical protein